jgi:hypothetical protein
MLTTFNFENNKRKDVTCRIGLIWTWKTLFYYSLRKRMAINHPGYYFTVDDNGENSGISKKGKNTKLLLFLILNS